MNDLNKNIKYALLFLLILISGLTTGCAHNRSAYNEVFRDIYKQHNYTYALVKADSLLTEAGTSDQSIASARLYRGRANRTLGYYEDAINDFNICLEILSDDLDCLTGRGIAYEIIGDHDAALADITKAYNEDPDDSTAYIHYVYYLTITNRAEEALGLLNNKIEKIKKVSIEYPGVAVLYKLRGRAFSRMDNYDKAFDDINTSININSFDADSYYIRSVHHYILKDYQSAFDDLGLSLTFDRKNPFHTAFKAWIYAHVHKIELASQNLEEAFSLCNKCGPAQISFLYFVKSHIAYYDHQYGEVEKILKKAIEIDPYNYNAYNSLGWLYATCQEDQYRDGDKALYYVQKALKISEAPYILDTLAAAYAEKGKFEEAMSVQQQVLSLITPNNPEYNDIVRRLEDYKQHKPLRESPLLQNANSLLTM